MSGLDRPGKNSTPSVERTRKKTVYRCSDAAGWWNNRSLRQHGGSGGCSAGRARTVLGFAVFGLTLWRAGAPWRFAGLVLLAWSVVLVGSNTEDGRAWLGLPFGVAWVWIALVDIQMLYARTQPLCSRCGRVRIGAPGVGRTTSRTMTKCHDREVARHGRYRVVDYGATRFELR